MRLMGLFGLMLAAGVTFATARLLVPFAHRHGLLDVPHGRKDHALPTPVVGGVAVLLGIVAACAFVLSPSMPLFTFLVAALLVVAVGVLDDLRDLSWRVRLVVQGMAALIIALGGVRAESVGQLLDFGQWAVPFTVFATIGVINAINMIDGADGLAGSQVAATLTMFAIGAVNVGNAELALQILVMLGGVAGFLAMNLRLPWQPRARIFLGNSGSALLGLIVAWCAYRLADTPGHPFSGVLPPWLVAIPLIDCVVIMLRRASMRRSPFSADRDHLHHLMLDAGYGTSTIVAVLFALALAIGVVVAVSYRAGIGEAWLVGLFLMLIGVHFAVTLDRRRAVALLRRRSTERRQPAAHAVPAKRATHRRRTSHDPVRHA